MLWFGLLSAYVCLAVKSHTQTVANILRGKYGWHLVPSLESFSLSTTLQNFRVTSLCGWEMNLHKMHKFPVIFLSVSFEDKATNMMDDTFPISSSKKIHQSHHDSKTRMISSDMKNSGPNPLN